ncbi:MAG: recombinase family protein [Gaiellaceae bacterium]
MAARNGTKAPEKKGADARAATVKRIVKLRKKGLGYPAIAKVLNDEKVATFGKGKVWYGPTVRAVCLREFGDAARSMKAAGTKAPTRKSAAAKK